MYNEIRLSEFGKNLTGRPFGKEIAEKLLKRDLSGDLIVNFEGVNSLGSSFAEEVLLILARLKNNSLRITHANPVVLACLKDLKSDFSIEMRIE